ncbi:MAG: hypothetical protein HXY43_06310 [Fischerella sp.]|uniref:HMA2 domain-containing protein n=1 Tax=Fischerella sp. TaxID=1191 RepID=UPI0018352CCD|nr:hypothetical protein [Fischerella sp.]NWF58917.1 hypothetical protein [Fischerella sp.]
MTRTISSRERLSQPPQFSSDLISAQQQSDEVNNHTGKVSTQSTAQSALSGLKIVHATGGRVRIRATDGSHNSIIENISQQLRQLEGVKKVDSNQQAGSLVILFDENRLSLPQMLAILQEFGIQQQISSQLAQNSDPFAAWKSIDFWKEQGISFIPLFTGLGVTSALGISGLFAIPVYMVTADTTRRVIDYIQPQKSASKSSKKTHSVSATKHQVTSGASLAKVEQATAVKQEILTTNTADKANDEAMEATANIAYSVVHAIPGRIRLSVPKLAQDRAYARRLESLLKTDPQVTNVRVNCDAASVMVAYESSHIPVSHWIGLMQLAQQTVPQQIPIKTSEQPQRQPVSQLSEPKELQIITAATPEAVGLWGTFKAPALSYALSFMANFPIHAGPD